MSLDQLGKGKFLESELKEIEDDSSGFLEEELDKLSGGFLEDELSSVDITSTAQVEYRPEVYFHSSENMEELGAESVHLAVTSPPYNTGWQYGSVSDDLHYSYEYLPMLAKVFKEVHRVLVPGGRFCVNVPSLLRSGAAGGYPIAADITRMVLDDEIGLLIKPSKVEGIDSPKAKRASEAIVEVQEECTWVLREQIAWVKGFNDDGLAPNGSFPRPWGILLNNMHEVILVFQKPGKRTYDDMSDERIESSKINKRQDDLCDDVWFISPENWDFKYIDGEDVPVFPEELPRRCIRLWSYEDDTVLDPFTGRGTTLKMAKELKRESVGYELREDLKQDINEYVQADQTGWDRYA